jgi:hypothetical protein
MSPRSSLLAHLHFNSEEKGLEHGETHHHPPQDPPNNEATLETWAPKPHALHSDEDEDNDSESGVVNHQTSDDEGAGQQVQRAQHDGQHACQPEIELPSQWIEVSKAEAAVTKIATKRLEGKEHAPGLSTPLSFDAAEIPRAAGLIETISPIDEGCVLVEDDNNPVSQIALSNCQYKLRNESQGAPLGRTSSGAAAGEPQSRSFLSYIKELALASFLTECPNTIAQAHRAQRPSLLSKHVASGGAHPGGTELCEVGLYPLSQVKYSQELS